MATQTQPPPAKSVPAQPRRLPFRVLIVPRNGPVLVSQPLDELAARLLVNGALAGGDQAQMVENHRPRDRWAEAAFAASPLVEAMILHSACSCGKCPPTQLTVRLAQVASGHWTVQGGLKPELAPVDAVSPEKAELFAPLRRRLRALGALVVGVAAGIAAGLLLRLFVKLAIGGGP